MFGRNTSNSDGLSRHCKECEAAYKKNRYGKDKARIVSNYTRWVRDNPDRARLNKRRHYEKISNSVEFKRADSRKEKLWRFHNSDKYAARKAKRRSSENRAIPQWADKDEIGDFYTAAKMFKLYTGREYHVDHIVPLQGDIVCGLHVQNNLQILEATENIRKSNKHWPDKP
jgi:hypothetical protein